jgi:hypothetical protein
MASLFSRPQRILLKKTAETDEKQEFVNTKGGRDEF